MSYSIDTPQIAFILKHVCELEQIAPDMDDDTLHAVLEQIAKFATEVLAPLNHAGDKQGARLVSHGVVATAAGWQDAYREFCHGGWHSLAFPEDHGGQGLPQMIAAVANECWQGANLAFGLGPLLTYGAIEALLLAGSAQQQATYVPRLVSGEWTGTMNLTESQAGSDLAAIRSTAKPQADGSYRLFGQKIFITYGEHDLTSNTIHMVLARTPDAPAGVKGISLFLVPKFLVNPDGSLGQRNDLAAVSLEHKLGIHASPTAVMAFGESQGAWAELIGEENRGLEYMFIMMNAARYGVGQQGVGLGERAYQQALGYARDRVQGRDALSGDLGVAIVRHPDVKRMLNVMKARVLGARMLQLLMAAQRDKAHAGDSEQANLFDLLIPVFKAGATDMAVEVASLGVQVHGGMGFIEETGAAQHYRDARILPIYEGTNGIQANDLVFRKVVRDHGQTFSAWLVAMRQDATNAAAHGSSAGAGQALKQALEVLEKAGQFVLDHGRSDVGKVLTGAVPFLDLCFHTGCAWAYARAAVAAAARPNDPVSAQMLGLGRVFATHVLPSRLAQLTTLVEGGEALIEPV